MRLVFVLSLLTAVLLTSCGILDSSSFSSGSSYYREELKTGMHKSKMKASNGFKYRVKSARQTPKGNVEEYICDYRSDIYMLTFRNDTLQSWRESSEIPLDTDFYTFSYNEGSKLQLGMPEKDVRPILGDKYKRISGRKTPKGSVEVIRYELAKYSYLVHFLDDTLVEWYEEPLDKQE